MRKLAIPFLALFLCLGSCSTLEKWEDELKGVEFKTEKFHVKEAQQIVDLFATADKNTDGLVDYTEIYKLLLEVIVTIRTWK